MGTAAAAVAAALSAVHEHRDKELCLHGFCMRFHSLPTYCIHFTSCSVHACSSFWLIVGAYGFGRLTAMHILCCHCSLAHSTQQLYTVAVEDTIAQAAAAATTVATETSSQDGGTFGFLADGFEAFLKVCTWLVAGTRCVTVIVRHLKHTCSAYTSHNTGVEGWGMRQGAHRCRGQGPLGSVLWSAGAGAALQRIVVAEG